MKRILYIFAFALPLLATSCLMEEKDLFDKTPAERLDSFISEYNDLLTSSEDGWLLEYYPHTDMIYGGYAYILKFTKSEVTAYFQLDNSVSTPVTSLYKTTNDDGPVLTFDNYNENIHFFSNPSASQYQALHGDYEFKITGKSEDGNKIYIQGRRTFNNFTLVKFSGDPVEYFTKLKAVENGMFGPAYEITMNETIYPCSIKDNIFTLVYTVPGATEEATPETIEISSPFCYTQDGIAFIEAVELEGASYDKLTYDAETRTLKSEDGKISIGIAPLKVEDLVGTFEFTAISALTGGNVKGTMVLELSDNPEKGNLMFTTMFDTECMANVYATFDTEAGKLTVASPQLYYASKSYLYGFQLLNSSARPVNTPVVFNAGYGEFGPYAGYIGDCAYNPSTGAYMGYFEVYYNLKATRVE